MVTLIVTGNINVDKARLTEKQLAEIRQAKYYEEKAQNLIHDVVFSGEFKENNKNPGEWSTAHTAVCYFAHKGENQIRTEIIYD